MPSKSRVRVERDEQWFHELHELLAVSVQMEQVLKELLEGVETASKFSRSLEPHLKMFAMGF